MSKRKPKADLWDDVIDDPDIRRELARESHEHFFSLYLSDYLTCGTADFHREMFRITQDRDIRFAAITAFRNSGKSTIASTSYPLWAISGIQQKKFPLILTQTQQQSLQIMENLRDHLEGKYNPLLKNDFGPFQEGDGPWRNTAITIPRYGAKIVVASIEQSIRGIRHGSHRPDLIICDDIEDLASIQTLEGRDRTYQKLVGEIIPAGDISTTKYIIVGNLLHEDSVMMRLKRDILSGKRDGVYREYPLLDEHDRPLWPQKFPSRAEIETLRRLVVDESAFQREYLLRIVSDQDRVIWPEWIRHYPELPRSDEVRFVASGVDLAISQEETADCTAMVSAWVHGSGDSFRIYILPHPINDRLTFKGMVGKVKEMSLRASEGKHYTRVFVEDVQYQRAAIEQLQAEGVPATGAKVLGMDKRARLMSVSHLVQSGMVLFPRRGAETLIAQLTGFGKERHDDLCDAFSLLLLQLLQYKGRSSAPLVVKKRPDTFADLLEEERKHSDFWYAKNRYRQKSILDMRF